MERKFKRRLINKISDNEIQVRNLDGEWNTYWAPSEGGYIRNTTHHSGTLGHQISYKCGNTLYWNGKSDLLETIKEWLKF